MENLEFAERFEVYVGDQLVGWSRLELGDPPMAVAFGVFIPSDHYHEIQRTVIAETATGDSSLSFRVKAPSGKWIQAIGVSLSDYSMEIGEDGIELELIGITEPPYDLLFPQHVEAYKHAFD